jgi:hypothetical protein
VVAKLIIRLPIFAPSHLMAHDKVTKPEGSDDANSAIEKLETKAFFDLPVCNWRACVSFNRIHA